MLIGYARVSTIEQNLNLQIDALEKAGCEKIFKEEASGRMANRIELNKMLEHIREGDTIIVWRLDRLGRSLKHLINLITNFQEKGIEFKSLQESIDTNSASGKLIFHIFAAMAEFESNIIKERVNAGIKAARKRGIKGGRKVKLNSDEIEAIISLYNSKKQSIPKICKMFGICKQTLYNYISKEKK